MSKEMAAELHTLPNAVWSTYGMTETLSHIALRRLNGNEASEWYEPFESVDVALNDEGCLMINAPLVCSKTLITNDIAEIAPDGRHFRIRGRKDNVICSGGIKMQIEEIEAKLHPHVNVPFIITKRKDEKFGETVVMLAETKDIDMLKAVCQERLSKYEQPHYYIYTNRIPTTETGKPARAKAMEMAESDAAK